MSTSARASTLVLGPEHNGILMDPEEFDAIEEYDDLYRYELIRGVLIVSPIPLPTERVINDELAYMLLGYHRQHPQGASLDGMLFEHYIRIGADRRRADRVLWAGMGRKPDYDNDPPTIAIEIVSSTRRDRRRDYEEKRDEYLGAGIAEYWVFDRFARKLTVFTPGPRGPVEQAFDATGVYRSPRLPGFEFSVAHFLEVADEAGE